MEPCEHETTERRTPISNGQYSDTKNHFETKAKDLAKMLQETGTITSTVKQVPHGHSLKRPSGRKMLLLPPKTSDYGLQWHMGGKKILS